MLTSDYAPNLAVRSRVRAVFSPHSNHPLKGGFGRVTHRYINCKYGVRDPLLGIDALEDFECISATTQSRYPDPNHQFALPEWSVLISDNLNWILLTMITRGSVFWMRPDISKLSPRNFR